MIDGTVTELVSFLRRGVVSTGDVDELLTLYQRALGGCAISILQRFGFGPWGRSLGVTESWQATHRRHEADDPSAPHLLLAPRGSVFQVQRDSSAELKERPLFRALLSSGFADGAITTIHNPFGPPLFLVVYREEGAATFTSGDASLMQLLHPHVAGSLAARSALRLVGGDGPASVHDVTREHPHAWIDDGEVTWSASARALFEQWLDLSAPNRARLEQMIVDLHRRFRDGCAGRSARVAGVSIELATIPVGGATRGLALFSTPAGDGAMGPLAALLSPMQRKVASMLIGGDSLPDIARTLGASLETIRTHRREIYRRLAVGTRVQLMRALSPATPSGG